MNIEKRLSLKIIKVVIYASLFVQILTTIISWKGMYIKLDNKDKVLNDILYVENIVQIIESLFYVWIISGINRLSSVTKRRYMDWTITTPMMLFTSIVFFYYQENLEKRKNKRIDLIEFAKDNKENIIKIFIYNGLMLLFGYLGEEGIINKNVAISIGFIFFGLSFNLIYHEYAKKSKIGKKLFNVLFIIWSLYGVSAFFGIKFKNLSYSILDIISKNFYGLYIYYRILKIKSKRDVSDVYGQRII
tara:strand:+ start:452 stop:1189 length:738 start_codon:yes stop_codon:yes gene_type:complete